MLSCSLNYGQTNFEQTVLLRLLLVAALAEFQDQLIMFTKCVICIKDKMIMYQIKSQSTTLDCSFGLVVLAVATSLSTALFGFKSHTWDNVLGASQI